MDAYYEVLPEGCPPKDSIAPAGEYFRLVSGTVPINEDFVSHRGLNPEAQYNACECTARAVSIFSKIEDAKQLQALPRLKGRKIAKVELAEDAGLVRRQGKAPSHHSWWRSKTFDVLSHCSIVAEDIQ